jgi:hypothetical protein
MKPGVNILKEMGHVYGVMNNFPEDPVSINYIEIKKGPG